MQKSVNTPIDAKGVAEILKPISVGEQQRSD